MFKKKKARVVQEPLLEALPVSKVKKIVGIRSIFIESSYQEFLLGTAEDYNGKEYDFEWDRRKNSLAKLSGEDLDPVMWQIVTVELLKFLQPKVEPKPEPKVEVPKIEQIEKIVEAVVEQQPSIHEEMEMEVPSGDDEEGIDFTDEEIFANAQKFLQHLR